MALHFGYISLLAPLSNVLCLWLISLLFVGGYAVVVLGALWPAGAGAAAWLLAWGDRDTVVHPAQSEALSAKLKELGVDHSTAVIAGGGHMLHDSEEYCRAVTGFLADALL